MGSIIDAHCTHCGFKLNGLPFGGGRAIYMEVCNVPALNRETGEMGSKNYFKKDQLKDAFDFYCDPQMFREGECKAKMDWGNVYLRREGNYCPQCKDFTLRFSMAGWYD